MGQLVPGQTVTVPAMSVKTVSIINLVTKEPFLRPWVTAPASYIKTYSATNSVARFGIKIIFLRRKNALAYYNAGVVHIHKLKSRRIGSSLSRSKSYDFWTYNYIQRQRWSRLERFS
jgi:hypothetical protein